MNRTQPLLHSRARALTSRPWTSAAGTLLVVALSALALGAVGCSSCDDDTSGSIRSGNNPQLEVDPTTVVFAAASVDAPETHTVFITNSGTGTITLEPSQLSPARGPFSFTDAEDKVLGAGESTSLTVTYAPLDESSPVGQLLVAATNGQSEIVQLTTVGPTRELQCNPTNFGAVTLGQTTEMEVELQNIGNLDMTVTSITMHDQEFQIVAQPELDLLLKPQQTTTVKLAVTPEYGGPIEDSLQVAVTESGTLFECTIRANVPVALIDLVPGRIDFGAVPTGTTVTKDVVVRNVGSADLILDGVELLRGSSMDFAVVNSPAEPLVVAPEASTTITVSYTAGQDTATGTAVFVSNDGSSPEVPLPLLGRPSRPEIGVSPDSIAFGNVGQGVTSRRELTIFNNGNEPLSLQNITVDGVSGEFAIVPDLSIPALSGTPTDLSAGTSLVVVVTYAPADLGTDRGNVVILSNDPTRPELRVPLTGNGLEGAECTVTVRPDPLNFGLVARGSTKELGAQVTNTGTGPCTYRGAQAAGILNNAFSVSGATRRVGEEFGPGEVMVVNVLYSPASFDLNNGNLTVNVTDPLDNRSVVYCGVGERCQNGMGNPFECGFNPPACGIPLAGTSGISDIAVIPGNVDFGLVTLGCASQTIDVTVYNTGTANLQIQNVYLDGCSPEFELRGTPGPPYPVEVTSGTPRRIQISYRPTGLGEDQCSLVIESDAVQSTPILRVPLRGEGTNISRQVDTFEQIDGRKVDALFMIDGSGSMQAEADEVARNLSTFLATAELLNNDFQIGVAHLDIGEELRIGGVAYEAGRLIGDPPFLKPTTPNYQSIFSDRVSNIVVGGGTQEAGLEGARKALSDPLITDTTQSCGSCAAPYAQCSPTNHCGGFNAGFLRDDASLEIIIVSDEEDQSSATPDFYVAFFQSIKGFRNDALLHVSTIIGADSNGNPANCTGSGDGADAGRRYAEVGNATGGTVGSICAASYASYLQNIGNRAFGLRREFFLSRVAEEATVEVRVNSRDQATGWTYDRDTNSVIFDRNMVPEAGSTIEVEYEAYCFE